MTTILIKKHQVILGLDPGSRIAGVAAIQARCDQPLQPRDFEILKVQILKPEAKLPACQRIGRMHCLLDELTSQLNPSFACMEKAFFGVNPQSALRLGEARGAMMSALLRHGAEFYELAPNAIKKIITGNHLAQKQLVQTALETLLGVPTQHLPYDATDALATALAFGLAPQKVFSQPKSRGRKLSDVGRSLLESSATLP